MLNNVILMENHGVLAYAQSISEALMRLQTLEIAFRMLLTALRAVIDLNPLPKETVQDFLENSGYRPHRKWDMTGA